MASKQVYLTTFSRANWKALPKTENAKHTLSFCNQCREHYYHLQKVFPSTSVYSHTSNTTITLSSESSNEREITHAVLQDLNGTYVEQFGHTFVESLVQNCKDVDRRKTKTEKKREQRSILRKCRDKVSEQMAVNVALHTLSECYVCYNHLRSHQLQKKKKSHSPSSANTLFNKEAVLLDLKQSLQKLTGVSLLGLTALM